MIEVKTAGPTFLFYDDPAELPQRRLHRFEVGLLQAGAMGTTLADLDTRLSAVYRFAEAGMLNELKRELQNARFGFAAGIEQGLSADTRALAELIISVGGTAWSDYSEAGLAEVAGLIAEHIPLREVREISQAVKKNLILS